MPDSTLSFQTKVDLSGLQSGVNQAKSVVSQFGTTATSAMAAAQVATERLTEAQVAFGGAAAQGNQQAIDIIAQYTAEALRAAAAVDALNASEVRETTTLRAGTSARMAASSELRVLEGNMMGSTRAAGALLASLPGIGEAMQAIFPVFGAVALLEVLTQLSGKIADIYEEWVNLRSLQEGVIKSILADETEEIRLSDKRLGQLREQRVLTAELAGGKAGRSDRGAAAGARFDVNIDTNDLAIAKGNLAEVNKQIDDLITKSKETKTTPITDEFGRTIDTVTKVTDDARRAAALVPELTEKAKLYSDEIDTLNQKLEVSAQMETLRKREAGEKEDNSAARSQLEQITNQFARLNAAKSAIVGHPLTAGEAASFWEQYLTTFKAKSSEATHVLDEFSKAQAENHKQIESAFKKSSEYVSSDAAERSMAEVNKELQKQGEDITRTGERWKEYNVELAKSGEIASQVATSEKLATLAQEEAFGAIRGKEDAYAKAAISAEQYKEKLAELDKELKQVQDDSSLTPAQKATQTLGIQNQIAQTQGQQSVAGTQSETTITNAIASPYLKAFDTIDNAWLKVQNDLIAGNKNIARDFLQMGVSIVQSAAHAAEQWLAKFAITWIKNEANHIAMTTAIQSKDAITTAQSVTDTATAEAAKTALVTEAVTAQSAAFTAGLAAQTSEMTAEQATIHAIQGSGNVATVTADAAVAAAGALAYWSAINPIIAPAMAANQFAITEAYAPLAAFEQGGIVGGAPGMPVPIMAHAGERVLSAPQTQNFERMVNGAGSGTSNSNHLTYAPQINAYDRTGMRSILQSHKDDIMSIVRSGYKSGGLG